MTKMKCETVPEYYSAMHPVRKQNKWFKLDKLSSIMKRSSYNNDNFLKLCLVALAIILTKCLRRVEWCTVNVLQPLHYIIVELIDMAAIVAADLFVHRPLWQ